MHKTKWKPLIIIATSVVAILTVSFCIMNRLNVDYKFRERFIPNITVVYIDTDNGQEPSFEEVMPPEGCTGRGIVNDEYLHGVITLRRNGYVLYSGGTKIKIRGNTSAYLGDDVKNPYKIKLEEKADLLFRGDKKYKDKEWALLKCDDLNTQLGFYTGKQTGLSWQPEYQFVNVVLNGDWKGSYLLTETVKKSEGRINIEESGFILENDAYWWVPDTAYFKSKTQRQVFSYTFKYPDEESEIIERIDDIAAFIDAVDDDLLSQDSDSFNKYDYESFASWFLAHDLLGNKDSYGSNMYCIKENNGETAKLTAGPVWDFENIFITENEWSVVHRHSGGCGVFDYQLLFTQEEFCEAYRKKWESISDSFSTGIKKYLQTMQGISKNEIQLSYNWDARRWGTQSKKIAAQIDDAVKWFENRTEWIDNNIDSIKLHKVSIVFSEDLSSAEVAVEMEDCEAVLLPTWSDKDGQDDLVYYEAKKDDIGLWRATIDFTNNHSDYGVYYIHIYYIRNGETVFEGERSFTR